MKRCSIGKKETVSGRSKPSGLLGLSLSSVCDARGNSIGIGTNLLWKESEEEKLFSDRTEMGPDTLTLCDAD